MPSTSLTSFDSIQPIQSAHFFLAKKNVPIVLAEYYQSGVIHHKNQMEKDIQSNVIIIVEKINLREIKNIRSNCAPI